jgi:hypothetical protein
MGTFYIKGAYRRMTASKNLVRSNSFGPFPQAPNHVVMSGFQNYFMTTDATGTPQKSPLAVAAAATTTINIPAAAVEMVLISSTALRISESDPAAAPYFVIPASTVFHVPCMSPALNASDTTGQLFLRADSADATVQFMFLNV